MELKEVLKHGMKKVTRIKISSISFMKTNKQKMHHSHATRLDLVNIQQ